MINTNQIATQLARMPDQALQQFAFMHKDDPYSLAMALSESNRRKEMRMGAQAVGGQPQPKVVDQAIQEMAPPQVSRQLPEEQGIGALPVPNMQRMADGGIVGFAEGKRVFSADKYLADPRVQRFLEYINKYEGSPKENQTVGYHQFDDLSKHPNRRVKFNKRGDKSTAAGAYQLINNTWQEQAKKQGLEDFSLENQKRAAIGVLQETGALEALMNNDIEKAKQRAARAWASIPGSTLGASTGQKAKFNPRAEQVLADITPQKVAETKKPAPAPVRAAERQETVGLSPERARQITELLPFASARAEDGLAALKKPATPSAAPATPSAAPAAPKPAVPLGGRDVPGSPEDIAYQAQLKAKRGPEKSYLRQRGEEILGAPEALASLVTGAFSPATGAVRAGIDRLLGGKMSVQEGAGRMTYAPRFEAGQESLSQAQRALEDFKVPPYIPGATTSRSRLRAPAAVRAAEAAAQKAREVAAQAEAAQAAASRRKGPAQGELFTKEQAPIPKKPAAKTHLNEAMQKAVEDTRRAEQLSLFTEAEAPVPPAISRVLKKRNATLEAAQSAAEKRARGAEDVRGMREAVEQRRQLEANREALKARERAKKAKDEASGKEVRAAEENILDRVDRRHDAEQAARAGVVRRVFPAAAVGANIEPAYPGVTSQGPWEEDFVAPETNYQPEAPVAAEVPIEERSRVEPKTAKKGFGLSDEDMLMLGLNLMSGESPYALQNVGRAGVATLGAKREREKLAADKEQRDIMAEYYKAMTGTLGTSAEERMIGRVMKDENISFADAIQRISGAKYAPRAETTERDLMKTYESLAKTPGFMIDHPDAAVWVQNQMRARSNTNTVPTFSSGVKFLGYE